MKKIITYIITNIIIVPFLILWTVYIYNGISQNFSNYNFTDWTIVVSISAIPYITFIIGNVIYIFKKSKDLNEQKPAIKNLSFDNNKSKPANNIDTKIQEPSQKQAANISVPIQAACQNNSSQAVQLQTAQTILKNSLSQLNKALSSENIVKVTVQQSVAPTVMSKSGTSYTEDDKMIARTDKKEITNEEVPYLIQAGQNRAMAQWRIPNLTRLISESFQIMRTTDNPETLCSRHKFIVEKINELATFEQQGLFDKNKFSQYQALISDDNLYNLIYQCYQKYTAKAKSELKTQNGINNRINKFWKIIYSNVSVEFRNSKLRNNRS